MTWGQRLYHHENPAYLEVVLFERRAFATRADILHMPTGCTPWEMLSENANAIWERRAIGHNIFTAEEQAAQHAEKSNG
jgi:hypothetical protein